MVGEEIDVVGDQRAQPPVLAPGDLRRLVAPEVAVMHEHGVRAPLQRGLEERLRGRHAGRDLLHAARAFNLQTVRAIVLEAADFQQIVQIQFEFDPIHEILYPFKCLDASGYFLPKRSPCFWP